MRRVLLPLLLLMSLSLSAQVTRKFMGEIVKQFELNFKYLSGINGVPSNKDTSYLLQQYDRFNAMASSVYEDADLNQKKALLYYTTVLEIRMGYLYAEAKYWEAAYERFYKFAEEGMKYVAQPGWFPVVFETDSLEHTLDRDYISKIEFIFYTDLLRSALLSGKMREANEAYATIKRLYKVPQYTIFLASSAMIIYKVGGRKIKDLSYDERDTLAALYADNISSLGQFDAADKQKLADNKIDFETQYNKDYKEVTELMPLLDPKWRTHNNEIIGIAYYDAKDTAKARDFFMAALTSNDRMESLTLDIAGDIAIKKMDKEMGMKVIEKLKEYHSWNAYELDKIGSIYNSLFDDHKSAKKYFREAGKLRKHKN